VYWTSAKHAADVDNRSAMAQKLETARFIPHSFLVLQFWPDIIERPQGFEFRKILNSMGGRICGRVRLCSKNSEG
jgi:hypothetical protein